MRLEIPRTSDTENGVFRDNLFVDVPEDIESKVLEIFSNLNLYDQSVDDKEFEHRASAWVDQQKNPPSPYEPTKEDLVNMAMDQKEQQVLLEAKLEPLQSKEELEIRLAEIDAKRTALMSLIAEK